MSQVRAKQRFSGAENRYHFRWTKNTWSIDNGVAGSNGHHHPGPCLQVTAVQVIGNTLLLRKILIRLVDSERNVNG